MCNLYSMTKGQQAVRELARAMRDLTGNLPLLDAIFPDMTAPVVRLGADGVRELAPARWGMPSPAFVVAGKAVDRGVTNIRNTQSPHWRRWLGPANRCLVPFTAFSESGAGADGRPEAIWFALAEAGPIGFFAGTWTRWTGTRRKAEGEITVDLFGFLTTAPNAEVEQVHPRAMPVILSSPAAWETWLTAPWSEARTLQRPLPDGALRVIARGVKQEVTPARDPAQGRERQALLDL